MESTDCNATKTFDFKTYLNENGETRVASRQQLPLQFLDLLANRELMLNLIRSNGYPDLAEVLLDDDIKLDGGIGQDNRVATLVFKNGESEKSYQIVIKGNEGNEQDRRIGKHREALVYEFLLDEEMRKNVNVPEKILAIAEEERGKQLLIMVMVPNTILASFIYSLQSETKRLTELTIPTDFQRSSLPAIFKSMAEQFAGFHSRFWCDHDKLLSGEGQKILKHASWLLGEEKSKFEYFQKIWQDRVAVIEADQPEFIKMYPKSWQAVKESMGKYSWDNYQRDFYVGDKTKNSKHFCLLHGDAHTWQMLWSQENQQITLLDFEFICVGHPSIDLGYLLLCLHKWLRAEFGMLFLKHYHATMISLGKVKADEFSFEDLQREVVLNTVPRISQFIVICALGIKFEEHHRWVFGQGLEDFLTENPEALKDIRQPHGMCN